jgi:putative transposase
MPRTRRVTPAGYAQHVLNRGNKRAVIFHQPTDYEAFLTIVAEGLARVPLKTLAYCLMPNHFHFVFLPTEDHQIPAYMHWIMNVHVQRYCRYRSTVGEGHVYQGRYKNFLIQDETHLLTVIRYVEANAFRAGLADRAEHWEWSSAQAGDAPDRRQIVSPWPFAKPSNWLEILNTQVPVEELHRLRYSTKRGAPYGTTAWARQAAIDFGLESTLRESNRPPRRETPPALQAAPDGELLLL